MALIPLNFGLGGGGGSDEVTATKNQVLAGYTAITSDSNDEPIEGTIPSKSATTYNTSTNDQTIASNQYLNGKQTIKAVVTENIDAENIKKGVIVKVGDANNAGRIKNIEGTYTTPSSGQLPITLDKVLEGYSGFVNGGSEVKGNIQSQAGGTFYATQSDQTIVPAGKYCDGNIILKKLTQTNFSSVNILRGKTINVNNGNVNVFSQAGSSNVLKCVSGTVDCSGGSSKTIYTDGGSGTFRTVNVNPGITPVYSVCICGGGWVLWRSGKAAGNLGGPGLSGSYTTTDMGAWQSNAVSVFGHSSGGYWCYWWVFGY